MIGSEHDIESLVERARKYVLKNFKEVTKTESFKGTGFDFFISSDRIFFIRSREIKNSNFEIFKKNCQRIGFLIT